ncbi:MAG: prepilin-type cleavage/methylation domain-containing protein [Verrucomicrobiota bacterium]
MYCDDNEDRFPTYNGWGGGGGRRQATPYTGGNAFSYGGQEWETNRPLNAYVQAVEVFHCPADHGSPLAAVPNSSWEGWGNSYLMQWTDATGFRVLGITGSLGKYVPACPPRRLSEIAQAPSNKILMADWPWQGNHDVNDPHGVWHNPPGKRIMVTLFGDFHVQFFKFPDNFSTMGMIPADPTYLFW